MQFPDCLDRKVWLLWFDWSNLASCSSYWSLFLFPIRLASLCSHFQCHITAWIEKWCADIWIWRPQSSHPWRHCSSELYPQHMWHCDPTRTHLQSLDDQSDQSDASTDVCPTGFFMFDAVHVMDVCNLSTCVYRLLEWLSRDGIRFNSHQINGKQGARPIKTLIVSIVMKLCLIGQVVVMPMDPRVSACHHFARKRVYVCVYVCMYGMY